MEATHLHVQTRDPKVKAKDLLKGGFVPLEFYGRGVENRSLKTNYQDFRRMYRVAGGNTVIQMHVDEKENINVLVHDVQFHPVTGNVIHVDLVNVRMDEKVTANIPLVFVGSSPAVREQGGVLTHAIDHVEVECLPKDLPHEIEVDISGLVDFHHSIHVSDIKAPKGVDILNNMEDVVASVSAAKVQSEEPAEEGAPVEAASAEAETDK